jgi:hypothetical protein
MKLLALLLLTMLTSGCSYMLCAYGLSCEAYYEERLDEMEVNWNHWLGKSKDERIKKEGPPDICSPLTDGGEVCEWRSSGVSGQGSYNARYGGSSWVSSWVHRRIFTYDRDHIARAWRYQGTFGSRESRPTQKQSPDSTTQERASQ